MPFRVRFKFLQYMPNKPIKYSLMIFWVYDACIPCAILGMVYKGRQTGEEGKKNVRGKYCSAVVQ